MLIRDFQLYVGSFSPILDQLSDLSRNQGSSYQDQQLQLLREQNEIIAKNSQDASNDTLREQNTTRTTAVKKASAKRHNILDDIGTLIMLNHL